MLTNFASGLKRHYCSAMCHFSRQKGLFVDPTIIQGSVWISEDSHDHEWPSKKETKISHLPGESRTTQQFELKIPAQTGRKERIARVEVGYFETELKPPQRRGNSNVLELKPLTVSACTVIEHDPPKGCKSLRWVLYTNHPIESIEEACEKIHWYKMRWQIEIYFKVMKSGFKVEKTRFGNVKNLEKYLVLIAILATRVMNLTWQAKQRNDLAMESHFTALEIKVLRALSPKVNITTLWEAAIAVAKLGGFIGRTHDGPPGPKTMWLGLIRLSDSCNMAENFLQTCG